MNTKSYTKMLLFVTKPVMNVFAMIIPKVLKIDVE